MGDRLSGSIITVVAVAAASAVVATFTTQSFAQTPAATGAVLKTSWGEPDLQGIWTDEFDTALQRALACTRFRRHRVRCFDGAGGASWRDGSLPVSSSLRLFG